MEQGAAAHQRDISVDPTSGDALGPTHGSHSEGESTESMVRSGIYLAESDDEKRAVYRFRYDVYVQEMGRYRGVADHENRLLVEPEDETARIFYAAQDGEVVGTSRFSWGGDAPFLPRLIEHYRLAPFLAELPPEVMAVGERGMVAPRLRGSKLFKELGRAVAAIRVRTSTAQKPAISFPSSR